MVDYLLATRAAQMFPSEQDSARLAACEDVGVEAGPEVPGGERKWLMDNGSRLQ